MDADILRSKRFFYAALALIVIVALFLRLEEFGRVYGKKPLDNDAFFYTQEAGRFDILSLENGFSSNHSGKEPLWVFFVSLSSRLSADHELTIRLTSLLFSLLSIILAVILLRSLCGNISLIAPLLLAVDPNLVINSVRGLREEMYGFLILCFFYSVFYSSSKRKAFITGVFGGLVCLTRLYSIYFVVFFLAFYYLPKSISGDRAVLKQFTLSLLLLLLMISPLVIDNLLTCHVPDCSVYLAARYLANVEFHGLKSNAGAFISPSDYLFGRSYDSLLFRTLLLFSFLLLIVLGFPFGLGLIILPFDFARREYIEGLKPILLFIPLFLLPYSLMPLGFESRYLVPIYPFAAIVNTIGLSNLARLLRK